MLKKVCVSGSALQETLVLGNLVLIDTLEIDMHATLHNDNHTAVTRVALDPPLENWEIPNKALSHAHNII